MPTMWSPPKTPQFLRSSTAAPPVMSGGMTVEPVPQVNVDDLVAGTGEWSNLQKIIRLTFKGLIDSAAAQHCETGRLHDFIKHLSQTLNSKVDRRTFEELQADVMRTGTVLAQLQQEVAPADSKRRKEGGEDDDWLLQRLEEKASLSFVQQALEHKVDGYQFETYRADVAGKLNLMSRLDQRLADLDAYVRATEGRLEGMMAEVARREVAATKPPGQAETAETVMTLCRRMELLQSELCRLARVVDSKADAQEVEAALKLKASKTSVQKRLASAAEEEQETMRRLKARVEELEGATDGMSRRWAEQEATLRRTAIDVEALRGRTVRSSEAISLTTQTNATRAVEGLAQNAAKKAAKLEKEMEAATRKIAALEQEVASRPTQVKLDELSRTVAEGVKALEEEIVKELDARDEELKQQADDTASFVRELDARVSSAQEELRDKDEARVREQEEVEQRLSKLEGRCEMLNPESLSGVVGEALREVEAGKLLDLARAKGGGSLAGEESQGGPGSSSSFKDVLHRLDSLDFDVAHAGMLFKVLQEVVCDALGALEGNMLQQMGSWAQESQRKGEDVMRRLGAMEARLEKDAIRRLDKLLGAGPLATDERVVELVRREIGRQLQTQHSSSSGQQAAATEEGEGERRPPVQSMGGRSLFSQRSRAEAFDPSRAGDEEDEISAVTNTTSRRESFDRQSLRASQCRGSLGSQASRISVSLVGGDGAKTPTPRSVLASIAEGTGGGGSAAAAAAAGFEEIVLRRLDHVEREVERLAEHSAGATAMEEGRNEQRSTADDQETAERLASLEQHQREVDQAIGDMQDSLLHARSQLRGLRLDHDQGLGGMAARVQAVEERLARGVLSLKEEKAGLDSMVRELQQGLVDLEEKMNSSWSAREEGGPTRAEAMRRLEEQVLACQEQIQQRMNAMKARMEQPIEGFAQAVAVMSDDIQDVKARLAVAHEASRLGGGGGGSSLSMAQKLHDLDDARSQLLEVRIQQLESESASLAQQLFRVTSELQGVNREVERLVAASPVPLPPLPHDHDSLPAAPLWTTATPLTATASLPPPDGSSVRSDDCNASMQTLRRPAASSRTVSSWVPRATELGQGMEAARQEQGWRGGQAAEPSTSAFEQRRSQTGSSNASLRSHQDGSVAQSTGRARVMRPDWTSHEAGQQYVSGGPGATTWPRRGPPPQQQQQQQQQQQMRARSSASLGGQRAAAQEGFEVRSTSSISEVTMGSASRAAMPSSYYYRAAGPRMEGGGEPIREEEGEDEEEDDDEEVRRASDSRTGPGSFARQESGQRHSTSSQHSQGVASKAVSSHRSARSAASGGGGGVRTSVSSASRAGRQLQAGEEQQLEAIRREKERLASLIPQLQGGSKAGGGRP